MLSVRSRRTVLNNPRRRPAELANFSGNRLILLISDCISSVWHNGKINPLLDIWSTKSFLSMLHLLPDEMKWRTGLRNAFSTKLRSYRPARRNIEFIVQQPELWPYSPDQKLIGIPAFTLDPQSLQSWAELATGRSNSWHPGFVFPDAAAYRDLPAEEFPDARNPDAVLESFRLSSSATAWELAVYFSVTAPLNLPVMRLIQQSMMLDPKYYHLIEVLMGGILKPLPAVDGKILNAEELRFDFVNGVRERLGNYLPQNLAFDVLSHTSNFVARNTHERITFPALLAAPELAGNLEITPDAEAFAWVSADVLRRYGGEYARLAEKLKKSVVEREMALPISTPVEIKDIGRENVRQKSPQKNLPPKLDKFEQNSGSTASTSKKLAIKDYLGQTVDFVIITAQSEERDALLNKLLDYRQLTQAEDNVHTYFVTDLPVTFPDHSTGVYRVILLCLSGVGRIQAVTATSDAIQQWHPRYVLLTGIASGIADSGMSVGDLLVSDQIVEYELQKLTPEYPELRWEVQTVDPRLLDACNNYSNDSWYEFIKINRPGPGKPNRYIGTIASGDKVTAFSEIQAMYRKLWPQLIGIEMEASGVASSVFRSVEKPGFLMIGGVSDFADENYKSTDIGKWREYACDVAVSYTVAFLQSGPVPLSERPIPAKKDKKNSREREHLYEILVNRVSPNDLKQLIDRVLGIGSYKKLSGNTHKDECTKFMEAVSGIGCEDQIPPELAKINPRIDLSEFGINNVTESAVIDDTPTPFIPFINRRAEWEGVVLYPEGSYYLFDGPSGCGKTALLQKIRGEFVLRSWVCALISIREQETILNVANQICNVLDIHLQLKQENSRQMGFEIGRAFASQSKNHQGLALLFDYKSLDKPLMNLLQELIDEIIPGIWNGLQKNSRFFNTTANSYRVVVAGQEIISRTLQYKTINHYYRVKLAPFTYNIVREICHSYLSSYSNQEIDQISAHIMFYSAGYPRSIVRLLELFHSSNNSSSDIFLSVVQSKVLERIREQESERVYLSFNREWRQVFEKLSIFRRLDYSIIRQLIDTKYISVGRELDAFELVQNLLRQNLILRNNYRHFEDIYRQQFFWHFYLGVSSTSFDQCCEIAYELCLQHIKKDKELNFYWAVECLFIFLISMTSQIQDKRQRQSLRKTLVWEKLDEILYEFNKGGRRSKYRNRIFDRITERRS